MRKFLLALLLSSYTSARPSAAAPPPASAPIGRLVDVGSRVIGEAIRSAALTAA